MHKNHIFIQRLLNIRNKLNLYKNDMSVQVKRHLMYFLYTLVRDYPLSTMYCIRCAVYSVHNI